MAQLGTHTISCDPAGTGLCLHPPSLCPAALTHSTSTSATATSVTRPTIGSPRQPHQLMAIKFGSVLATGMTEMQAAAILRAARLDVDQLVASLATLSREGRDYTGCNGANPPGGAPIRLSIKGSLQQFLQKRGARFKQASATPYAG